MTDADGHVVWRAYYKAWGGLEALSPNVVEQRYRIQDAEMAHLTDAVKYWNQKGGYHGPKPKEVRGFMREFSNYELEYFGHNRSQRCELA